MTAVRRARPGPRRGEAGSTSLEVVLLVPVLMLLALFVLWAGRGGRAALVTDLAAEEAATAAALACEKGKPGCEDLVVDLLRARPGLDFLCIGGPRPAAGRTRILEEQWLDRDDLVPDPASGVTAANTEVSGVGVLEVSFVCETDGAVAPLRGVFPTVEFRGHASEVAVLQGAPRVGVSGAEVTEGDPADPGDPPKLIFTLMLDAPSVAEVVLPYTITGGLPADGRATEGADYTPPSPLTVTIAEGATTAEIEVEVVRDVLYEADETVELVLGDPPDPALLSLDQARRSATGTILNDDDPPSVHAHDAAAVTEGDGVQLTFRVEMAAASGVEVTVDYDPADGTAEAENTCGGSRDPDYVDRGGTLTFAPGETEPKYATVTIGDDTCGEGPETVELRLQASGGARFSGTVDPGTACTAEADAGNHRDDCAVGTVLDDEPGLSVNDVRACENADPVECGSSPGDPAGTLVFTVTRTGPDTEEVTVRVGTADDNAPGAAAGSTDDYTTLGPCSAASPEVTIPAGVTTVTVAVALTDDTLDEDDETLLLELCRPSDNAWIDTSPGKGTIIDDDDPPTVRVSDASMTEAGGLLRFNASLSAPSGRAQGVTVEYCTNDGTAAEPADYTEVACPPSQQVRFGPGETGPVPVAVTVVDDDLEEEDETVVLRLDATNAGFDSLVGPTDPCPAAVPDDPSTPSVDESETSRDNCAVGTVEDDDPPLLRVDDVTAIEGMALNFTVSLVNAADPSRQVAAAKPITAVYTVSHASTEAGDFTGALSGTVSFAAGERTQPVRVQTFDDPLDEFDETFELELSVTTAPGENPAAVADADTPGTGAVTDNDDEPTVEVVDDADGIGASVDEPADGEDEDLTFTVRLSAASAKVVTVDARTFSGTPDLAAVPNDDVPAGDHADYTAVSRTLTFNPGDPLEQTVAVPVLADDEAEDAERLQLRLSAPAAPGVDLNARLGDANAVGVIRAECRRVSGELSPPQMVSPPQSVREGDQVVARVELIPAACESVGVRLRTVAGSATAGSDFRIVTSEVSMTFAWVHSGLRALRDYVSEPDETFIISYDYNDAYDATNPETWNDAAPFQAVVTILGSETTAAGLRNNYSAHSAFEGNDQGGVIQFQVQLTYINSRDVTVTYMPSEIPTHWSRPAATGGPACTGDVDFIIPATAPSITIPAGSRFGAAPVNLCGDTVAEEEELLLVRLVSAETVAEPENPSVSLPIVAGGIRTTGGILNDD